MPKKPAEVTKLIEAGVITNAYEAAMAMVLDDDQFAKVKHLTELLSEGNLTDAQIKEAIARLDDGPEVAN
jgi:hypothetical protein